MLGAGAALTVGMLYVLSLNLGMIAQVTDVVTGWYVTPLGVATTAAALSLNIFASGVQRA